MAVIARVPALSELVENVATPEEFKGLWPITSEPSRKVTYPVGTPPDEVTVAVKVTV